MTTFPDRQLHVPAGDDVTGRPSLPAHARAFWQAVGEYERHVARLHAADRCAVECRGLITSPGMHEIDRVELKRRLASAERDSADAMTAAAGCVAEARALTRALVHAVVDELGRLTGAPLIEMPDTSGAVTALLARVDAGEWEPTPVP